MEVEVKVDEHRDEERRENRGKRDIETIKKCASLITLPTLPIECVCVCEGCEG